MKRVFHFAICSSLLLLTALAPAFAGEVLDGVVASVNHHPILLSEWDEAVRFEAFMERRPVNRITAAERTLALQHLIDRQLLAAQMADVAYMQPTEDELQGDIAKLRAQVPDGKDDAAWQRLLASYGLTEEILKQHLRNEVQVMNFVEVRLRPDVHINEDEVEGYYKDQLIPDLQKSGGKIIPLDEVKSRIHELLTQQRMDELLDVWLHNLRQQAEIRSSIKIPGVNAPEAAESASGAN